VRLVSRLEGQVAELDALRARIRDLRDGVLPLAAAAATSSLGSYGAGELDLTAVLDAQDERFRAELRLAGLIASYGARRAALEALLGEEWYR
jgi:outer membrane protein TolC